MYNFRPEFFSGPETLHESVFGDWTQVAVEATQRPTPIELRAQFVGKSTVEIAIEDELQPELIDSVA